MDRLSTTHRLKQIMNERNLKQVDILRLCKPYCEEHSIRLEKNDLSQYISGKSQPKQNKLYILSLALNVSEAWLMGYDVPIERPPRSASDEMDKKDELTPKETTLVHNYRELDDIDKSKVEERIDTLLDSDKYKPFEILPIAARGKGNTSPGVVEDPDALTKALEEEFPEN